MEEKIVYYPPCVEVVEIEVEQGFAVSSLETPEDGGIYNW